MYRGILLGTTMHNPDLSAVVCVRVCARARACGRACVCACLCVSDITDLSISWLVVNDHERFSLKQFHSW